MPQNHVERDRILQLARANTQNAPKDAEELYRSILIETLPKPIWYEVQAELGYVLWLQAKNDDAQVIFEILLERGTAEENEPVIADAYTGLARIYDDEGTTDQAIELCQKAIAIYRAHSLREKEAIATNVLAATFYYQGKLDDSIHWYKQSLQLIPQEKNSTFSNVLNNLGLSYRLKGDIERAAGYFQRAYQYAEQNQYERVLATYYNNYAETLCLMGDYQQALQYFKLGLEKAEKCKDTKSTALIRTSYANYLIQTGQLEPAYRAIIKSIQIYSKISDPLGEILAYVALANYWVVKGHLKKCLAQLERAWEIVQKSGIFESSIEVLVFLAEINESLGETDAAYNYLKTASQIAQDRNSDLGRAQVLIQRGLINVNQNQYHEAELLLNEALWITDQIQHYELKYKAQILLARNYLGKYAQEFQEEYFNNTMDLIKQAKELAWSQKLIPRYINALIIQGMLYSSSDDNENAKIALAEAKALAIERGMIIQARNAQERLSLVTGSDNTQTDRRPFKKIVLALIMDEISRATTTYLESNFSEVDLDEVFMTVFTIDDEVGTRILETENIDLDDPFWYKQIHQIASLYSISLGQGQAYHEGLFGPLPFGETELRSIIFTRIISDKSKAVQNQDYVLFAMVFPKEMMPLFYDRKRVEVIFTESTNQIIDLAQITHKFLVNMHETIIAEIIADVYDPVVNV